VARVATKLLEAGASCVAQDKDGVSCAMTQCLHAKYVLSLLFALTQLSEGDS
jgi:hypothetical protein